MKYSRQWVREQDIQSVVNVLRSDMLTTGEMPGLFEKALAKKVGTKYAVVVSSGTAALHAAMFTMGVGAGDEVIVSPMTFAASANCVLYQGGIPIFADIDQRTLLIDPEKVEELITPRTVGIIAVDYAGRPCDYSKLAEIVTRHDLILVADACHSLGGTYKGEVIGRQADVTTFSFHPVKAITTGEGGALVTNNDVIARFARIFRNHGRVGYEMYHLGYNYRITDFQCALGLSQLQSLDERIKERQRLAALYYKLLDGVAGVMPLPFCEGHAYHLFVIKVEPRFRDSLQTYLRQRNIGATIHYPPVHLHQYYQRELGTGSGDCPIAEEVSKQILSLPLYPQMTDNDVMVVVDVLREGMKWMNK